VPRRFHGLHRQLILLRDQTVAHVDAQGALYRGLPANNVRLIVHDGQVRLGIQEVKFKLTAISEVRELANVLVKRMLEHTNKLVSKYPNDAPEEGEYLID
jgi:hypothetical protein